MKINKQRVKIRKRPTTFLEAGALDAINENNRAFLEIRPRYQFINLDFRSKNSLITCPNTHAHTHRTYVLLIVPFRRCLFGGRANQWTGDKAHDLWNSVGSSVPQAYHQHFESPISIQPNRARPKLDYAPTTMLRT